MKTCKWCQEEINEKAKVCPHCRKKQKSLGCGGIVLVFICLIMVGGMASSMISYDKVEELTITNTKGNVDAYNVLTWEGDITNNGEYTVENIKITFTCYTSAREKNGVATTEIEHIKPGETLHFTAKGMGKYKSIDDCEYEIE